MPWAEGKTNAAVRLGIIFKSNSGGVSVELRIFEVRCCIDRSYKRECQEKSSPVGSVPKYSVGIQPE
jgi:hypothetical protein